MNIINEIMRLNARCNASRVFAGEGVNVEHHLDGCVVSMDEQGETDAVRSYSMSVDVSASNAVVAAGKIHVGTTIAIDYAGGQIAMSAGFLLLEIAKSAVPTLHIEVTRPSFYDSATEKYQIALAEMQQQEGSLVIVKRFHVGDLYLPLPAEWIGNYTASSVQLLGHTSSGVMEWYTPSTC